MDDEPTYSQQTTQFMDTYNQIYLHTWDLYYIESFSCARTRNVFCAINYTFTNLNVSYFRQ